MTPRRSSRRLVAALAVAVVATVVCAACGISSDDKPRTLDANELPAALAANPTGTTVPEGSRQAAKLYLVKTTGDTETLVGQMTQIPEVSDFADLPKVVIEQLIAQQPSATPTGGSTLINAIPATVQVLDATVNGNVLDLNLSDLSSVELTRQRQAAAQIVFTATALPGIDAVRFSINGQQTAVPLDNQLSVAGEPVNRSDYPKLMPTT